MTPFSRRLLLMDVHLALFLPHLHEALRKATLGPLGRMSVTLDCVEADVQPWSIGRLAGRARWEGARSELVPGIEFGVIDAQLSTPEPGLIRAALTNRGGDLAISGALTLDSDGGVDVDLFLEPRSDTFDAWAPALEALATREGAGWRLRRMISTGSWR